MDNIFALKLKQTKNIWNNYVQKYVFSIWH